MPLTESEDDDDEADEERIARAVDQAREDVAADGVGAEQECRTCRPPARPAA